MSTTPLPIFTNGQVGSASQLMSALNNLYEQGQSNLETLTNLRTESLIAFQRRISYLNSKQVQANKLVNANSLVNFSLADFSNIDQSETTSTVRIDTNVATCLEQDITVEAVIKSINFSSSLGSVETLISNNNLYRVYNTNNQTPVGTFNIVLTNPINLSVLVFDLPSYTGTPTITVNVSNTGITYTPCLSYSLNGYRLIVYLTPAEIQYIQLNITPTLPDNLGGSLYTFGITDFVGSSTQYRLLSEFVTKPIVFNPTSLNCQLNSSVSPGVLFFLSLNGSGFFEVDTNTTIPIPGVSEVVHNAATVNSAGLLSAGISSNAYLPSLKVLDVGTSTYLPVIFGLTNSSANISNLSKAYISVVGTTLYYIPYVSGDSNKTFNITYLEGPSSMTAQLKVQLSTNDKNTSPIFNGATLLTA